MPDLTGGGVGGYCVPNAQHAVRQAKRLAKNLERFPEITVPTIYDELSGTRVLTMELIRGIKISKADELREAGFDLEQLGDVFIRSVIKQVLIDGFFHGDPHPGNLMAVPEDHRLVFLDLGLIGQLSSTQRVDLLGLIYAVNSVDIPAIADGLIALGTPTPGFDAAIQRPNRRSQKPRRGSSSAAGASGARGAAQGAA